MKEQLERRLKDLQEQLEKGQNQLLQLDEQRGTLEKTLLRISGAIQVLSEELQQADEGGNPVTAPTDNGQLVSEH